MRPLILALALFCAGCVTSQRSGSRLLNTENDSVLIPAEGQALICEQALAGVAKQYKKFGDAKVQAHVAEMGLRLQTAAGVQGLSFIVLDSPQVNAFALPCGQVYVTTGILAKLKSDAELAVVMGHEIGHVTRQHAMKQLQRQIAAQQGLDLLLSLLSEDKAKFASSIAGPVASLLFLRNGREAELESDEVGIKLASSLGLDASAMIQVQEMLMKASGAASPLFGDMLSTHPASQGRISQARALLPKYPASQQRDAASYQKAVLARLK